MRIKIEACQKALKEKTDICFDFKRGKTGRGGKWLSIIFTIYPNMAKKALIESTAKEIKKVLKERVNKTNESLDKPNETTTTTKPKYNDFKKKYNTPRKKTGLPSFEYKRWNPQVIDKLVKNHGYDDDDYDNDSNDLY